METICILGLGYIGLPTASMFAKSGKQVIGVDVNPKVIEILQKGQIHIEEPGLDIIVNELVSSGRLQVKTTPGEADAFIIAVPTPINSDKTADMRAVSSAAKAIVPFLRKGNLVILESTSPPCTTTHLVRPILESSGLQAGTDFLLAYSPERVLPGQIMKEMVENDRVIGGINSASALAGRELYSSFVKGEILLTDATTAEMVKLMENTFRDVNIALSNEFALIAEELGVNIWEAIPIANRHPRVKILNPGPGVGGHCIAVDPWFLAEMSPHTSQIIQTARKINDMMPHHVVELVRKAVSEIPNPIVVCLGLTYKANVDDIRESPSIEVLHLLQKSGITVRACDPHVDAHEHDAHLPLFSLDSALDGADCAVLLTDHKEFKSITPTMISSMRHATIVDTRNALAYLNNNDSHLTYLGVGNIVRNYP